MRQLLFYLLISLSFFVSASNKQDIKDAQKSIKRLWNGQGEVITGILNLPNDCLVSSRTPLNSDGSFCTKLYKNRKLTFYAHSYEPIIAFHIPPLLRRPFKIDKKTNPSVYVIPPKSFSKAKPENLRTLKANIELNGTKVPIKYSLEIHNKDYLWSDHGNTCGAPLKVRVDSHQLTHGSKLELKDLSRIPYYLILTAPGYIKQEIPLDPKVNRLIDLETITLKPALKYRFTYRARTRMEDGKWKEEDTQSTTITCNGNAKLKFSKVRDGLGNSMTLRLKPLSEESVEASFFYYQRDSFFELSSEADSLPEWNKINTLMLKGNSRVQLQDKSLYYFNVKDINDLAIQLVFKVERVL